MKLNSFHFLLIAGILLSCHTQLKAEEQIVPVGVKTRNAKLIGTASLANRADVLHNVSANNTAVSSSSVQSFEEALAGTGCESTCDSCQCGDCCCDDKLFGLFVRSDHAFDNYISPMTNPVFFEDPRTLTELRIIYMNHRIPSAIPGDYVNVFAAQMRFALNDRLSIIATKDGFITSDNGSPHPDGWADVSAGLKYNIYADECCQQLLSIGFTYEIPVGSNRSLQSIGDGEFNIFASGAMQLPAGWQFMSGTGFRLPTDTQANNQMWYWSNHVDHQLTCCTYFFAELNWFHWLSNGSGGIGVASVGGHDLYNFGAPDVAGKDLVTGAVGLKYKPSCHTEIGVAWEAPLTSDHDLIDNRLTIDWIFRY